MANTNILLGTTTVGAGGAASISFTSISSSYTDLCVYLNVRSTVASTSDSISVYFNGTTANYYNKNLKGNGAALSQNSGDTAKGFMGYISGQTTASANNFSIVKLYIPNYGVALNKTMYAETAQEDNVTTAYTAFGALSWANTAAISTVSFSPGSGSFAQYSSANLYGIKSS